MAKVNLGGDRVGSGNKMEIQMHGWERSTHNLEYIWRSTQAPGTIVPFLSTVALPEDTWDIDLNANVLTHPTIGPLFGSFKVQLDVFWAAMRLYNANLMINATDIGNDMQNVKLPVLEMTADWNPEAPDLENSQVNPSCLLAYLGYRGVGATTARTAGTVKRIFNGVPYLVYWDIVKNFYANKQEEIGYAIHNEPEALGTTPLYLKIPNGTPPNVTIQPYPIPNDIDLRRSTQLDIEWNAPDPTPIWSQIIINTSRGAVSVQDLFYDIFVTGAGTASAVNTADGYSGEKIYNWNMINPNELVDTEPKLVEYPLSNIDAQRKNLMAGAFSAVALKINEDSGIPFSFPLKETGGFYSKLSSQEGLAVKTYQSDIFNNWLNAEWIDSVNAKAQVSTAGDVFTVEALIMANKIYNHFNRIAVSDGTYMSWLTASWDARPYMGCIAPEYQGGLSKELIFQEVVSNSAAADGSQPLGTLAGRGTMGKKHKGGKIRIKPSEIGYIQGMISLTPRIDYSQGNSWDVNLLTMDDFHKPAFDQIGWQDLITDKMYWPETTVDINGTPTFRSAGKQPAWLDYTTNYNKVYGNFAVAGNEMFMTLNRKYEPNADGTIKDLTTYIDPVKFNQIFAYTKRDAMNFWVQVGIGMTVRRKMSARQIPNL